MAAVFLFLLSSTLLGLSIAKPAAQEREKRQIPGNYYDYSGYRRNYYTTDGYANGYSTDPSYGAYTSDDYYRTTDSGLSSYNPFYHGYTTDSASTSGSTSCRPEVFAYPLDSATIDGTALCLGRAARYYPNDADWTFTVHTMAGLYLNFEYDVDMEYCGHCACDELTFGYGTGEEIHVCGQQKGNFSVQVSENQYQLHFRSDASVTRRGFNVSITADHFPRFSTSDLPHYNMPADGRSDSTPYYHNDYTSSYYSTDRYSTDRGYGGYTPGYSTHDYYNSYRPNYYDYTTDYTSRRYHDYTTDNSSPRYNDYTTYFSSPRYNDYNPDYSSRRYHDYTTDYSSPRYHDYTTDYSSPRYNDYTTDYTSRRYHDYTTYYSSPRYHDYSPDYSSPRYHDYTTYYSSPRYHDYSPDYSSPNYGTSSIDCRRDYYIDFPPDHFTVNGVAECGTVQGERPGDYPNNAGWIFGIYTETMHRPELYLNIEYDIDIESATECVFDKLTFGYGSGNEIPVCGVQKGNFSVQLFGDFYELRFQSDGSVTRRGFNLSITVDHFPLYSTNDLPHYNSPASGGEHEGSSTPSYYTTDRSRYGHRITDYFIPPRSTEYRNEYSTPREAGPDEYPGHGPSNEERKAARLESLRSELRELVDAARETVLSFDGFEDAYYQDKPRDLTAVHHDMPLDPSDFHHDMLRDPSDFLDMPRDDADFQHDMPNDVYVPLGIRF